MHDDTVVASGHASATPPMSVMNSRRLTASPSLLETTPYHIVEWVVLCITANLARLMPFYHIIGRWGAVRRSEIFPPMSVQGLGRVKTKSELVVIPSGRQIFGFCCSPHGHRAQNCGCDYTA